MSLLCILGFHSWNGCKCSVCAAKRNEGHNWNGCKCIKCGKSRDENHNWINCKCSICNKTKNHFHSWEEKIIEEMDNETNIMNTYKYKTCSQCGIIYEETSAISLYDEISAELKRYGELRQYRNKLEECIRRFNTLILLGKFPDSQFALRGDLYILSAIMEGKKRNINELNSTLKKAENDFKRVQVTCPEFIYLCKDKFNQIKQIKETYAN